jgi:hypothetical protein
MNILLASLERRYTFLGDWRDGDRDQGGEITDTGLLNGMEF